MLNVPSYLLILAYILNIHESKFAQVGHLYRPFRYAAFYTILNASALHVTSPLATLAKGQLFGGYLLCLSFPFTLGGKRVSYQIMA